MAEPVSDNVGQDVFRRLPEKQTCQVHHCTAVDAVVDQKRICLVIDDERRPGGITKWRREDSEVLLNQRRFVAKELKVGHEAILIHLLDGFFCFPGMSFSMTERLR